MRFAVRDGRPALDETDPDLRLTEEQRAVFRHDRELVLSAGAGTGKTHTVALRFVALLVHLAWTEARPERVLVLTFTDRAAAEMAERCRARLAEAVAAADAGPWPAFAANLRRMLAAFESATIGTFHGFCASLVRRPGTAVLDPLLAAELRQDALAGALADLRDREPEDVFRLLDAFGTRDGVLRAGAAALGHPRAPLLPLAERIARAPVPPAEARASLVALRASLSLLVRLVAPSGGGPAVAPIREALAEPVPDDPLAVWGAWREHLDLVLTERGALRSLDHASVLGAKASWPDPRRFAQAREAAEVLGQRLAHAPRDAERARRCPTPADRVLHEILPVLHRLLDDAEARLDAALDRRRALTFDALQDRAVAAVTGDEGLRRDLRERFRYLMVDEFQDTDAAQWSLVRALGRERPDEPEDRIFVVGDPKQAIYGFRGGDVTMFRAAVGEIGAPLHLSRNFRSRPELVQWFDRAFPTVFGAPRHPWEVGYDPLVAGREEPGGRVERIETDLPHPEVAADLVAEALAAGDVGTVAILLRARTHQDRYEAALRARGIPYTVPAGVGFWSRPEVVDLVTALLAAWRPDPIATLAWLRGPLGALPDGAVDRLGAEGLTAIAEGAAPEGFEAVAARFLAARRELAELPPSAWLERRIDELVPAFAIAEPSGRALRNARRLVDRLRPLDVEGVDVVARVARRALDADEREGEAPAEVLTGVILTTVHGAKGLEFDVVVVPELDRRAPPPSGPVLRARVEGRWELAFPVDDPDAEVQSRARPGLYEAVRGQLVAEQDAEERRLLYVAATRARERLVLLGEPDPPVPGGLPTWHQLLRPATPELRAVPPAAEPLPPPPLPADEPAPRAFPAPREVVLSVSELLAFDACPAAWGHARGRPPAPEPREAALRAAVGRLVHEILEDDDEDGVERRWSAAVPDPTPEETAAGLAAVRRALAARADPAVARLLAAPGRAEVAFRVARGPVALRGRIDRLVELPGEGPVVVDWKTGRRAPGVGLQLAAYAWAAARALGRPVGARVVWAAEPAVEVVEPAPERVEALLDAVASAEGPDALLALARAAPRPCAGCPFAAHPCPEPGPPAQAG